MRRDQLDAYCRQAASHGVAAVVITEHFERFHQARPALQGAWNDDPNPELRVFMDRVFDEEQGADLDEYIDDLAAAQREGMPVLIGIELGWWPGHMAAVSELIARYPFDLVLGSVHNLGAWMFDAYNHDSVAAEWDRRSVHEVWEAYTRAVEQLAASRICDVLAHIDLIKIIGMRPADEARFNNRLAEAAATNGLAVEVSSAGWRKPVAEAYPSPALLRRLKQCHVPITLASDAHRTADVADRFEDLRRFAARAGYDSVLAFHRRARRSVGLQSMPTVGNGS